MTMSISHRLLERHARDGQAAREARRISEFECDSCPLTEGEHQVTVQIKGPPGAGGAHPGQCHVHVSRPEGATHQLGLAQLELFVTLGPPGKTLRQRRGRVGGGAAIRVRHGRRARGQDRRGGDEGDHRLLPERPRAQLRELQSLRREKPRRQILPLKAYMEPAHGEGGQLPLLGCRGPGVLAGARGACGVLVSGPLRLHQRDRPDGGHDQQPVFAEPDRGPGRPEIGTGSATTRSACWTGNIYDASAGPHLGDEDLDQYLKNAIENRSDAAKKLMREAA